MAIYLIIFIPIIFLIITWLLFKNNITVWEAVLCIIIPIIIIFSLKALAIYSATRDIEWYGTYGKYVSYYEDWNEYIHQTCTREVCTGSGKNQTCTSVPYDCSYVEYHPKYWTITDNIFNEYEISENKFNDISIRWKNKYFEDLHRNYYTNDGDVYRSSFNNDFSILEPITTEHAYENRVAVSSSIFNFTDINNEGLFEYPNINNLHQKCLLGLDNQELDWKLQKINALLGFEKQIRIYILVWEDQPLSKAFDQQQYWKNGNKNELIINIGIHDNNVTWAYIFSWTPNEQIKINIRKKLENNSFDLNNFLNWLPDEINQNWVRKEFKDFDYIAIEPSTSWIIAITIITIITSFLICLYSVINNIDSRFIYENINNDNTSNFRFDRISQFNISNIRNRIIQRRDRTKNKSRSKESRKGRSIR